MIALGFSILFSSLIFVTFNLFKRYNINKFQAIVINYFTAFTIGILSYEGDVNVLSIHLKPWFWGAFILAFLFISVFNVMGITAQNNGVSVGAIASKMAVVLPIIFGVFLYSEQLNFIKILGIILALIAVYMSSIKETKRHNSSLLYPILLFIGSGVIDTLLKFLQNFYVTTSETILFSGAIFGFAGLIVVVVFIFRPSKISYYNLVGGLILGVINYYSIFFLLKALGTKSLLSSQIFTINNVSIVMLSTMLGVLLFKETLSKKNTLGIILAVLSICLISL